MTALTDIRGERSFFRKTRGNAIVKLVRERKSLIQLEQHYLNDIGHRVRSQWHSLYGRMLFFLSTTCRQNDASSLFKCWSRSLCYSWYVGMFFFILIHVAYFVVPRQWHLVHPSYPWSQSVTLLDCDAISGDLGAWRVHRNHSKPNHRDFGKVCFFKGWYSVLTCIL